jgi:hypothetical protein
MITNWKYDETAPLISTRHPLLWDRLKYCTDSVLISPSLQHIREHFCPWKQSGLYLCTSMRYITFITGRTQHPWHWTSFDSLWRIGPNRYSFCVLWAWFSLLTDFQCCTPGIMNVNTSDAAETLTHSKYPHCVNHSTKMKDCRGFWSQIYGKDMTAYLPYRIPKVYSTDKWSTSQN